MTTTNRVICNAVSKYFGIDPWELFQKSRKGHVVWRRQLFHYLALKWTSNTLFKVGHFGSETYNSGYYDHATVLHSKKTITNLLYIKDKEAREAVAAIEVIITKLIYVEHNFIPTDVDLLSKCIKLPQTSIS